MARSFALGCSIAYALAFGINSAAAAPPAGQAVDLRVSGVEVVAPVTGADSPNETADRWDIHGTDLGHMFRHDDALYMVFGDTFGEGGLGGDNWRSNTMARVADGDPRDGLKFASMISADDGLAKELIPSQKLVGIEKTVIPTYGISLDGRMYLHYMSVRYWGAPGHWNVRYSGFAYSDDDGQSWHTPDEAIWPGGTGFEQVALVEQGDYVYSFGIPEGRHGSVRLRRVGPERLLDRGAYEYWDGDAWVKDASAAREVVPAPAGELSVAWSEAHQRWLMMYLHPARQEIVLRTAPSLTGPWGEAQTVVTAQEHPGLYSPYIVPTVAPGEEVYFTMSRWDTYNVYLMRAQLEAGPELEPGQVIAEPGRGTRPSGG